MPAFASHLRRYDWIFSPIFLRRCRRRWCFRCRHWCQISPFIIDYHCQPLRIRWPLTLPPPIFIYTPYAIEIITPLKLRIFIFTSQYFSWIWYDAAFAITPLRHYIISLFTPAADIYHWLLPLFSRHCHARLPPHRRYSRSGIIYWSRREAESRHHFLSEYRHQADR